MKKQWGGTFLGFILGILVGLAGALVVAIYVTNVPVPFVNKGQSRNAQQDADEAQKNKNWDPNTPLYGKSPTKPASEPQPDDAPAEAQPATPVAPSVATPASTPATTTGNNAASADKKPEAKPAVSADPLGDLVKAKSANAEDAFAYYVQLGAYRTLEDAESQRAKFSLGGIETKITEREQAGRPVFRVRTGPFDKKEDAERSKEKFDKAGFEAALVRVQR